MTTTSTSSPPSATHGMVVSSRVTDVTQLVPGEEYKLYYKDGSLFDNRAPHKYVEIDCYGNLKFSYVDGYQFSWCSSIDLHDLVIERAPQIVGFTYGNPGKYSILHPDGYWLLPGESELQKPEQGPCTHPSWVTTPGFNCSYRNCSVCDAKWEDVYPQGDSVASSASGGDVHATTK